ncbi:MAG: PHP domain-containing protein [Ruminococcaceae bacterium]|nr:PHP domain-containing protein [Oscillospiraceae bacterium]
MNRYYYDFHIHSCLSPCGDDDMTPNNIAGMGALAGLQVMALTDHNTCKNCPAFYKAARKNGIIPIAGMELTTAEDIHIVCLFENLEDALRFDEFVDTQRIRIKNRPDIFGEQQIMDENDDIIGKEEFLLSNATLLTIEQVPDAVGKYNGICYPAHIDREANGVIATLGTFPEEPFFRCAEFHDKEKQTEYKNRFSLVKEKTLLVSSDAHYLWDIRDKDAFFEIDDEPYSSDKVRKEIFRLLRGE